eukprot:5797038-Pyramimonas_sp.AAC.2
MQQHHDEPFTEATLSGPLLCDTHVACFERESTVGLHIQTVGWLVQESAPTAPRGIQAATHHRRVGPGGGRGMQHPSAKGPQWMAGGGVSVRVSSPPSSPKELSLKLL